MITVGITTYNRIEVVRKMAKSLYDSIGIEECNIRIYDDCSSEYGVEELKELFPSAVKIFRQSKNMGADLNTWFMYIDFLNSSDNYFFNADSDLIFDRFWIQKGLENLKYTDGVLSLFNTKNHPSIKEFNESLCIKQHVGAAGTLFTRGCIELIVNELKNTSHDSIDWRWCKVLNDNKKNIYVLNKSAVQHIGFWGQNSDVYTYDYGVGFEVNSLVNAKILCELNDEYIKTVQKLKENYCNKCKLYPVKKLLKYIKYNFCLRK